MSENCKIREKARVTLERKLFGSIWITMIVVVLIYGVIVGIPSGIGGALPGKAKYAIGWIFSIASVVISAALEYGLLRVFMKTSRGDKKIDFMDLFVGFKEDFQNVFLLGLIRSVLIFLWSLLLIIPGIIKAYAYSMAVYIQQDSEDKEWRKCLELSNEMTYGYKGKLFLLDLSFIGWYIVGLLCLGVGVLWVSVYHGLARAHFYEELKAERKDLFGEPDSGKPEEETAPVFEEEKTEAPAEEAIALEAPAEPASDEASEEK